MTELRDSERIDDEDGRGLREYVEIVLRRLWVTLLVFGVVLAGSVYMLMNQPVSWVASCQIVLESQTPQILGEVAPVVDTGGTNFYAQREYQKTQHRIIGSRSIAEEVAERLDLGSDLAFLGLDHIEDQGELSEALQAIDVVELVMASVRVEPIPESQVVSIIVETRTPESAAAIANMTAQVYIDRNMDRQVESVEGAARWLEDQYASLRDDLQSSEEALVNYRREHGILAVELEDNVSLLSEMQSLSQQLQTARLEADRLGATVSRIEEVLHEGDLLEANISDVIDNGLIQTLKARAVELEVERLGLSADYLDQHPEMVALAEQRELIDATLEREIRTTLASVEAEYSTARQLERRLAGRLNAVEREVQQLGDHEVQYAALVREVEGNREIFAMIERRLKEVEITRNSHHNNVVLLEAAQVPEDPHLPNRMTMLALAALLALALGIAVPVLLESLDHTVKTKESLEREFALTFLGIIPSIRPTTSTRRTSRGPARGEAWNRDTFVHDFPKSSVAESCRSIRTNLLFMATEKPLDRLLISSASPREGKTTTVASIGTVMAQSGTRVLLVDTDMRRPRLHTVWGFSTSVGLSSLLLGEATADEAIKQTPVENLFVLPSGPVPPNPTELMHTERFQEVLRELGDRFDRIIFDSPPITPVTDASILSGFVDGVMLVVKAGSTRKELLGRAIERLRSVRSNIVGVVLNDVDVTRRQYGYYYSYYYRRHGLYYGEPEDDELLEA